MAPLFEPLEILKPREREWTKTEPTVRVRPRVQLQYRHPILEKDQYTVESCEKGDSNIGPAAENGEKAGDLV